MGEPKPFMVEDGRLIYRNFSGENGFSKDDGRNFCVLLEPEAAEAMAADGWNIKVTKPRPGDEDEEVVEGIPFIQVKIKFDIKPPKITVITDTSRTVMTVDTVGMLDWADIRTVDLIAVPYNWTFAGKSGYSAYLKTMFITIEEDALERKYALMELEE